MRLYFMGNENSRAQSGGMDGGDDAAGQALLSGRREGPPTADVFRRR